MTKEEQLKQEAEEYAQGMAKYYESAHGSIPSQFEKYLRNAYISSAEPREKRISELEELLINSKNLSDTIEKAQKKKIADLEKENAELKDEVRKLKLLVSSLVYEINQIWDINEMNDDLRMCAEKIDREVQLSKMAEDNRMVISALGFAIVPPKPKLDVKEV